MKVPFSRTAFAGKIFANM
jgi:hypothetical protein